MHAFSFGLKRAHLSAAKMQTKMARAFELTPARFDVMFILRGLGGSCDQSELWKRLGVTRQTMAVMLRGMEEKGLVWRIEDRDDKRRRSVRMTTHGLEQFVAATKEFFRTDKLRERFDAMHEEGRAFVAWATELVKHVGQALGDLAHHYYSVDAPTADDIAVVDSLNTCVRADVERLEVHRPKRGDHLDHFQDGDVYDSQAELTGWDPWDELDAAHE